MKRQTIAILLFGAFMLLIQPVAAQPLLKVSGAAEIEMIDIGKSSGVIGHTGNGVMVLGDANDDEVQIKAGQTDPISLWVNQSLLATTIKPSGILNLHHQSRTRWSLSFAQTIPQAVWKPIEFDFDPTLLDPDHFDEQAESVPGPGVPWTFIATEEGYYQVNARTGFENFRADNPGEVPEPDGAGLVIGPGPTGGVSIAIFKIDLTGAIANHSQGNNLQIYALVPMPPPFELPIELFMEANNAPNVSDVVHLRAGEMIQIHAWWDGGFAAGASADLATGRHRTYVSVHKIS